MRLNTRTRFPHPVLCTETTDYTDGAFKVEFEVRETPGAGNLTVEYTATLSAPPLEELLTQESATIALFIVCRRTYFDRFYEIPPGAGSIEFPSGELKGKVLLRPIICAKKEIDSFCPESLNPEFGDQQWTFRPTTVLAIADDSVIDVGLDKLAPMETIFELVENSDVPDGQTRIQLDEEKIHICASKDTRQHIHNMRSTSHGRAILLNGVYFPAIMEVLAALQSAPDQYMGKRWHSVFSAKCTHLGINLTNPNPHEDAQRLLQDPLNRIKKMEDLLEL